jgi:hypothetical protein
MARHNTTTDVNEVNARGKPIAVGLTDLVRYLGTNAMRKPKGIARTHGPFCFRHSGITQAIGSIDGDLRIAYHFLPQLGLLLDEVRTLCG